MLYLHFQSNQLLKAFCTGIEHLTALYVPSLSGEGLPLRKVWECLPSGDGILSPLFLSSMPLASVQKWVPSRVSRSPHSLTSSSCHPVTTEHSLPVIVVFPSSLSKEHLDLP